MGVFFLFNAGALDSCSISFFLRIVRDVIRSLCSCCTNLASEDIFFKTEVVAPTPSLFPAVNCSSVTLSNLFRYSFDGAT